MGRSQKRVNSFGGYFLIDAKDLDAAMNVTARIPAAQKGTVEVRRSEIAGLPNG